MREGVLGGVTRQGAYFYGATEEDLLSPSDRTEIKNTEVLYDDRGQIIMFYMFNINMCYVM